MAINSRNITNKLIQGYIEEQEDKTLKLGQFQIDSTLVTSQL